MLAVVSRLLILLVFSKHSTAVYSIEDDDDHSDNTRLLPPHCTMASAIYPRGAYEIICENEIPDFESYNQTFLDTIAKFTIHRCLFLTLKPDSFRNLRNLTFLTIDCDTVQVREDSPAFLDLPRLWELSIGKNVVAFPPPFFCQLKSLRYLTVSHNNISSEEAFGTGNCSDGNQSLTSCHISVNSFDASHNNLTSISNSSFFCNLKELGSLNLNNNAIESIEKGALDGLGPYLRQLHLRGNLIKELPVDMFKFARSLQILDLSNNLLSHLPVDIFKLLNVTLYRLQNLDLSNNRLQNVDNIFQNLSLRSLYVSGNQLETIDSRTLRGLKGAYGLNFSRNAIRTIAANVFDDCTNLLHLDLSYNRLKDGLKFRIKDWFYDLRLDHNDIEDINATDFKFDSGISHFSLSYNKITSLGPKAFALIHKLYNLDLSHNRIETIDDLAFHGLHSLTTLDLSGNRITRSLVHQLFKGLSKLTHLDLSFNQLTSFDMHLLEDLKSLRSLNLESNQLTNSPVWDIFSLSALSSMAIGGNPWSCKCTFIIPFKHFLTYHARLIVNAQQLYCKHEPLSDDVVLLHTFNITHCDQPRSIERLNNMSESFNVAAIVLGTLLGVTVVAFGIFVFAFRNEIKMVVARRISKLLLKK